MKNRYLQKLMVKVAIKLGELYNKNLHAISARTLPVFAGDPRGLTIELPRKIANPERITIGCNVSLGPGCMLMAIAQYPGAWMKSPDREIETQYFDSRIIIGDNVTATERLQIASCAEVIIGNDVMFASNVHINDSLHGFRRTDLPYKYQPLQGIAPIRIGQGCWIGQNVVILPGVEVGELSIIGANSVVTRNVPARAIATGSPARVIKEWDEASENWIKCCKEDASMMVGDDH
jgi:acetyltransferase-like isoleucine patch superfamily enzyme